MGWCWDEEGRDGPDMYWERSSFPWATPFSPLAVRGSQRASVRMLWFGPGTMETLRAVAWPISVPLLDSLMFTYGTMAE